MGTRNLTMVVLDSQYKVAQYGQWDGYPSGQGSTVLEFLRQMDSDKMKIALQKVRYMTAEDIDRINATIVDDKINGMPWQNSYPELSRDLCAGILDMIYTYGEDSELLLRDDTNFAADSLFCEWAYLVNLDDNTLEVYKGFVKSPLGENDRFNFLSDKAEDGYHPIKIVKSYSLSDLPDNETFVDQLTGKDVDED